MIDPFAPLILESDICSLLPLSQSHHDDLLEAVKDGELFKLWYALVPAPEQMQDNIELRLSMQKEGHTLPFAVIDNQSGRAVGMTCFLNIDRRNRRVEIGGTWYRKSAQNSAINTTCKQLLLTHAFEAMNCIAVEFRTHAFNHKSRRAIERLGAKLDGVLRHHMLMPNGAPRDTYVYSIINSEWPMVKAHLTYLKTKST